MFLLEKYIIWFLEGKNMNPNKMIVFKKNTKSTFFWNMVGGFCNSITSFLLLLFVTRILGSEEAGIFSFAFAIAQLMLTIGKFGMRAYQSTDVQKNIRFSTYLVSRLITSLIMVLASCIYTIGNNYESRKQFIILLVCLIKISDAVEDIFHGELQRIGQLDVAGKLLTLRNIFTLFIFAVSLYITRNLLCTCLISAVLSIFVTFLINIWGVYKCCEITFGCNLQDLKRLFIECFPLFIASFLSLYIYNAPKNAIDRLLSYDYQTYYSVLFMPTFVINLFSEFAFKPVITNLALYWETFEIKFFSKIVYGVLTLIVLLTVSVILVASFLGIPILSFMYGVNLSYYKVELLILLAGGGFGAGAYFLYNVLTSMRKQKIILIGYTVVAVIATILSPDLVKHYHMIGAALSYFCSIVTLFFFFFLMLLITIFLRKGSIKYEMDR